MDGELPPGKKPKLEPEKVTECSGSKNSPQPNSDIAQSPVAEPTLMPEMWAQIFEYMPPDELQTVMNTTPQWNRLLHSQKPRVLFLKVLACLRGILTWKEIMPFRLVSKACKIGAELAYPEIPTIIRLSGERVLAQQRLARAMEGVNARFRMGMRHEARNQLREAQGLPAQEFREKDDGPDRADEFSKEEMQAYLLRRFQRFQEE